MKQFTLDCIETLKAKFTGVLLSQFDSAIQLYIDNYLGDILEERLLVKDLAKGVQNIRINRQYLNTLLNIDSIVEANIGSIQLTQLCLIVKDVRIVLELGKEISREDIFKEQEESLLLENKLRQAAELRQSIFGSSKQWKFDQSVKQITSLQNSNFQKFIPILEILNSNPSIKVSNIVVSAFWSEGNTKQTISIIQNDSQIQLSKHAENNKIFIQSSINQLQIKYNNTIIGQMDRAIDLKIFIDDSTLMKANCLIDKLAIVVDHQQFKSLFKLTECISARTTLRNKYIQEYKNQSKQYDSCSIHSERLSEGVSSPDLIFQSISDAFSRQHLDLEHSIPFEQQNALQELTKVSELIDLNISHMNLDQFFIQTKDIMHQKDDVQINAQGLILAVAQECSFDPNYDYHQRFISNLDSHIVFKIRSIQVTKLKDKISLIVRKISAYQIVKPDLFMSVDGFASCKGSSRSDISDPQIIAKSILQIGQKQYRKRSTCIGANTYAIKEPNLLNNAAQALTIIIMNGKIKIETASINMIADSHQIRTIMDILPTVQSEVVPYEDPERLSTNISLRTDVQFHYLPHEHNQYWNINFQNICVQSNALQCQQLISLQLQVDKVTVDKLVSIDLVKLQYIVVPKSVNQIQTQHLSYEEYMKQMNQVIPRQISIQINNCNAYTDRLFPYYLHIFETYLEQDYDNKQSNEVNPIQQEILIKVEIKQIIMQHYFLQMTLQSAKISKAWIKNIVRIQSMELLDLQFKEQNSQKSPLPSLICYISQEPEQRDFLEIVQIGQQTKVKLRQVVLRLHSIDKLIYLSTLLQQDIKKFQNRQSGNEQIQQSQSQLIVTMTSVSVDIFPTTAQGKQLLNSRIILKLEQLQFQNDLIQLSSIWFQYMDLRNKQPSIKVANLDLISFCQIQNLTLDQYKDLSVSLVSVVNLCVEFALNLKESFNSLLSQIDQAQKKYIKPEPNQVQVQNEFPEMKISLKEVSIIDRFATFNLNLISVKIDLMKSGMKMKLGRCQIFDLIKTSKYKYIMDQESTNDYSMQEDADSHFGIINFHQINGKTSIDVELKPIRVCLSGALLENLLHELETFKQIQQKSYDFDIVQVIDEEEDEFEILEIQESIKLEAKISPLVIIVSFNSSGIKPDGLLKGILKLGSINNFMLTSDGINFQQNDAYAYENLIEQITKSFGSTLDLTYNTYKSLGILKPISELTVGVHQLLNKSLRQGDIIGGFQSLSKGLSSSVLSFASIPGKGIEKLGKVLGVNVNQIKQFNKPLEDLYYRINPEQEIPKRFFK